MFALRGRTPAVVVIAVLAAMLSAPTPVDAQKNENKTYLTPPYFNLAEGRKVYASATCGEDTEGPELYCKLVGPTNSENDVNINVIHGQHCDICDPTRPDKQHPPEFAVNGRETWWQSPPLSRGMKYNEVNLTIDLGQEFHVAYVYVRMGNSPRPGLWILEKSADYGKTYVPWQYFAETTSDCSAFFGDESLQPITKDDSIICTTDFSRIVPLEGGEIPISLLNNRPSANNYFNSSVLQEWTRATNVRLRLLRTKNLLGHLMSVTKQDPTVTRRYFYSIKDISIGGRCMCNGHADSCDNRDPTDHAILVCLCRHNTCGLKCDRCCPGFEQKAWRQRKESDPFECEPCNCFNHSNECEYDPEVDKLGKSLDIHGNYAGGGVCKNCRHNTEGINCNRCMSKFYRPHGKRWDEIDVCQPCDCERFNTTGNCEEGTGTCECRKEYLSPNCDSCSYGHYGYPDCKPCDCFLNGTTTYQCEAQDGICECLDNFGGDHCKECADDYFKFPECQSCECNPLGSVSSVCDKATGNCTCKTNYGSKRCEECQDGYYDYPSCTLCSCDIKGTEAEICDKSTGKCICKEGYTGVNCDQCDLNFYGYPDCKPCNCSAVGSSGTTCGATGKCTCLTGFAGRTCEQCSPGYYKYPECLPCDCDSHGANGVSCNNDGICQCHHNFEGEKCDRCRESFYNFPACEECNCNPAGVISAFLGCGSVPKGELCQCKDRVEGRICDKCKPLYWNLNAHNSAGCEECHCNVPGVLGGIAVCDSDHGQCTCKPNVVARRCTECDDGTYNLQDDNLFGCTDCGCDVGGSISQICHKTSGQCQCQPRITGQTCKEPIGMHYFPTLYQHQYEAEDGRTEESNVIRFAYNEEVFPNYSWKGYAKFNHLQTEILQDLDIHKPSLYRVVLRYVNTKKMPIQGVVKVIPDNPNDYEQQYSVTFQNTTKPEFVTMNTGNAPVAFVMNPGTWIMHIQGVEGLLLDYFVILPEEFYMATILNQKVLEPCVIQPKSAFENMDPEQNLCRQFKYPEVSQFATSKGSGAFIDLGDNAFSGASKFYDDKDHLDQLNLTNVRIPMVCSEQPEIDYNITLKKQGRYVVLVNYVTPLDNNDTHYLNVTTSMTTNEIDGSVEDYDQVALYNCPYTTMCRQVVVDHDGVVKVYHSDGNRIHLKFSQGGTQATGSVGIHSVLAIPYEEWSLDYIQPRPICIQKDGDCVKSTYPNPEESKKIRFEKNAVNNENLPKPVVKIIHGNNYVYLNQTNNAIDIRSKVANPGFYTFVIHYYQPDHPEFDVDILIQNGFMYEAKLPVAHCPKIYGCRAVVTQKDGIDKFSLTENFMLTVTLPNGKPVYLDNILVVPADLYTPRITEEDDFGRTDEFINTCGQNHFHIDPKEKGFCRDSVFSITAGYNAGALTCSCDYAGSLSFDCEKFGGQCQCKENVIGRDCSACKAGHFGFPDCRPCNCPKNSICEQNSGQCICPPRVHGEQCDQCTPLTYGFDEYNGCEDCKCNPLGVEHSLQCNLDNGNCPCKPHIVGRKCDTCLAGFYNFPYCSHCECNVHGTTKDICDQDTAECFCKKLVTGPACDICMEGTYNLQANNELGCTECFCFGKTNRCYVSAFLHRIFTYNMNGWNVSIIEENFETLNVTKANVTLEHPNHQGISFVLGKEERNKTLYFSAPGDYLGKRLTAYGGFLNYTVWYTIGNGGKATLRPDVILVGANNYLRYDGLEQPPADYEFTAGLQIVESNFVLPSGSPCKREHLMTVLKDLKGIYIRANYWSVTDIARLSAVTLDDAEKSKSRDRQDIANTVELCDCPPNYTGLSCEDCAPGYYRISTGPHGGYCVACSCNGHASECDLHTGVCINCQHNTVGDHCDQCAVGYHGNAKQGTPMDCLICACPMPITSNNFASSCDVSADGERIHCTCDEGYMGARCQSCSAGYYGRPEVRGDYCKPCECSGNIDTSDIRSCDTVTGQCLQCLNNTFGPACALCAPSYYGDAVSEKNCQQCVCDSLGTSECNSFTGECVCRQNVVGDKCDRCEENHYGYASGQGCQACACSEAAIGQQCDDVTGQCRCKPGVTGRTCNKCKSGYWNLTSEGCISCGCRDEFSIGLGCNALTGQCECLPGVTGDKCDQCPYRWAFVKEYGCHSCDSCTDDLLDFTDYLAQLIDPIQTEFQTAGTGYFQARRLAHINDTISKLRPKVEAITPDKVNFKPILSELDTMANDANNMNRKANYSLDNSKNLVDSSDIQRAKSWAMLDKVQMASDNVANTIDDIKTMAENLAQGDSPRVEDARKLAQLQLEEMKAIDISQRDTDASKALDQADNLLLNLEAFKVPIDEFGTDIKQVSAKLKDINSRLDDLANQTQFSLGKTQEAKTLYDNNGKDRLEKKLLNINTQTQLTNKNINESQALNKNSTKLLEQAHVNYEDMSDQFNDVQALSNLFEDDMIDIEKDLDRFDARIPVIQEYADNLWREADILGNILNETLIDSEAAVRAATAYANIEKAVGEAKEAVYQATEDVDRVADLLDELVGTTDRSEMTSADLLDVAELRMADIKHLEPDVENATKIFIPVQEQHAKNKETLENMDKALKNYVSKNMDEVLLKAKKNAENAEQNAKDTLDETEKGFLKIEYNVLDSKNMSQKVFGTNQAIVQVKKELDSVNDKLPEILKSIDNMPAQRPELKRKLESKINKLNEQIALARDLANRIELGVVFKPSTTLELHNPDNLDQLSTSTQVSGYFKTGDENGVLLFLGNGNGTNVGRTKTDDYMALEVAGGYPRLKMDLGNGEEEIINTKYVADNKWYQFVIDRVGLNAKLSIKEQLSEGAENVTIAEKQLDGPLSIFNLDRNQSRVFIGSHPTDFEPPLKILNNVFNGAVEDVVIGDTPVSLWNFNRGYDNNEGAKRPSKLTHESEFNFNGNGYAIFNSRSYPMSQGTDVELKFKTFASEGLIFLYGNEKTFLSLELRNGKILYKFNLGSGTKVWHTKSTYNDGEWHTVNARRAGDAGRLEIDNRSIEDHSGTTEGNNLEIQDTFTVGGYPQSHNIKEVTNVDFKGCVKDLKIIGRTVDLTTNIKSYGMVPGCPTSTGVVSFYPARPGFVNITNISAGDNFIVNLRFKTNEKQGLIFYVTDDDQQAGISLSLDQGRLKLISQKLELVTKNDNFDNNDWHVVSVTHNKDILRLDYDDLDHVIVDKPPPLRLMYGTILVGGLPKNYVVAKGMIDNYAPFAGCIADATVNGDRLNFANASARRAAELGKCVLDKPIGSDSDVHVIPILPPLDELDVITEAPPPLEVTSVSKDDTPIRGDGGKDDGESDINEVDLEHEDVDDITDIETTTWPTPRPHPQTTTTQPPECALPRDPALDPDVIRSGSYKYTEKGSRLEFSVPRGKVRKSFVFSLEFKTLSHNGIIFYVSDATHKQYVTLYLQGGYIYFTFNSMGKSATVNSTLLASDNVWHKVTFRRDFGHGELDVDGDITDVEAVHNVTKLDVAQPYYIGGVPEKVYTHENFPLKMVDQYMGCIRNFHMNDKPMEAPIAFKVIPCSDNMEEGIFFSSAGGYLRLKDRFKVGIEFDVRMDLRPRSSSALIMAVHGRKSYFVLELHEGALMATVDNGKGPITAKFYPDKFNFCDGNWHAIQVVKSKSVVTLQANGVYSQPGVGSRKSVSADTIGSLFLGGHKLITRAKGITVRTPYVGCIRNVVVNGKAVQPVQTMVEGGVQIGSCPTI